MRGVDQAKEYIRAGDIIQVVLSQRFTTELRCDPFDVYRALRAINPSPYLFYLQMKDSILLGASPEVMVRLEGDEIELRPLAGTRRRGKSREEDLALEKDLLADEKEGDGADGRGALFPRHAHRFARPREIGPGEKLL
jgi:anthranilate synthase component 1